MFDLLFFVDLLLLNFDNNYLLNYVGWEKVIINFIKLFIEMGFLNCIIKSFNVINVFFFVYKLFLKELLYV